MANVKVTDLTELSVEQMGKFTWFLASHETDEHDERTSNKISYPTISSRMSTDLCIYDMQCAIEEATGGQSARIVKIRQDLDKLSTDIPQFYTTKTDVINELAKKQDCLSAGMNIKTISINGSAASSLLGEGNINLIAGGGGGGGPTTYLKSAAKSDDGNTLFIYDQNDTQLTFSPSTGGGGEPTDYQTVKTRANYSYEEITGSINPILGSVSSDVNTLKALSVSIGQTPFTGQLSSVAAKSFCVYDVAGGGSEYGLATLEQLKVKNSSGTEITDVIITGTYFKSSSFVCVLYNNTDSAKIVKVTGLVNGIY